MRRFGKILIIMILAAMLGACTVRTADDGTVSTSDEGSVGIENPFIGGGEEDDDNIIISEGGSSGGSGSPPPAPATPEYEPLEIKTQKLEDGYQTRYYYKKLEGVGGSGDYEWSASSALPLGLEISDKRISGTVAFNADAKIYTITITLKDTKTEESVSKDFSLKIIEFLQEEITIDVEEFVNNSWQPVARNGDHIDFAAFDAEVRRLRLSVLKKDSNGELPSAPRYHWAVESHDNKLGVFVPPLVEDGSNDIIKGQIAYLMPWKDHGVMDINELDLLILNEEYAAGTELSVIDDFGNTARVTFGELKALGPLEMEVDEKSLLYDVMTAEENWTQTELKVKGGLAPYEWVIGTKKVKKVDVSYGVQASAEIKCKGANDNECDEAYILWDNIMITKKNPKSLFVTLKVWVTDARGSTVSKVIEFRNFWPTNPMRDTKFTARAQVVEACHTDADTRLHFRFFNPGHDHVATADFELDPVPCDPDEENANCEPITFDLVTGEVITEEGFVNKPTFNGYWMKEARLDMYPLNAGMWYSNEIGELGNPNDLAVEVHTTAYGDENGQLNLDLIKVEFSSTHWSNYWVDGRGGLLNDEAGNEHHDITGLLNGWTAKWDAVPSSRRTW